MLRILNLNGDLLLEVDADNLSGADLSCADLSGADLSCADLSDANLRDANLRDADLSCADLRDADLIVITWSHWTTYITKGHIRIGCQSHTLVKWRNFSDDEISEMDTRALDFWKQNKDLIIGLCERFDQNV